MENENIVEGGENVENQNSDVTSENINPNEQGNEPVENADEAVKATNEKLSQTEKAEIDKFIQKFDLPKGVEYFLDKNNQIKFVVPINGQKYIATPQDIFKGFNINQAGYQKLEESKSIEKEVKQLFSEIKKNPRKLFEIAEKMGIDPVELSREKLSESLKQMSMTESERQALKDKEEKERLQKELEELRLEKEQTKLQSEIQREQEKIATDLISAMNKHGFISKDTKTKSHIMSSAINKMLLASQNDRNLSVDDAIFLAKQEWQNYVNGVFDEIDDNHIVNLIPERIIKAIRKADLARLSKVTPTSESIESFGNKIDLETLPKTKQTKKVGLSEYFDSI